MTVISPMRDMSVSLKGTPDMLHPRVSYKFHARAAQLNVAPQYAD